MQVTIGAKCYDGFHSKSLSGIIKASEEPKKDCFIDKAKRLNDPKVKSIVGYTIPAMFLSTLLKPLHSMAAPPAQPAIGIPDGVKQTILHSFDPLIDLIQALAYPIAGVMIAGGCLFIMVGNRDRGMSMLQNAAIGYILVQLSPMLLKLLVGIGSSVA
jgi:hypothetical protein